MCNGSATFQCLMNILLAGIQWHSYLVYLDDIIVFGRSFTEHIQNLAEVSQRLRDANLRLQVKKCIFCRDTVKFLGHVIPTAGIRYSSRASLQHALEKRVPRKIFCEA